MNKRVIFWVKMLVLAGILVGMGLAMWSSWDNLGKHQVNLAAIDWRFGLAAVGGFCGVMFVSGLMWIWLARRMGDRGPVMPLLGAYTFSQLGKYIPGKVVLLLMRIERSGRFGMKASVCTIATLLENALYMISGALVGIVAVARVAGGLDPEKRALIWPATIGVVALLVTGCHPRVFYGLVNAAMRKFKKPEVPRERQLGMGVLVLGVAGFLPCWIFGGVALWASANCMAQVGMMESWWFAGAFGLSVIIGMASMMPGGVGFREAVVIAALTMAFSAGGMAHDRAFVLAGAGAVLQRVFQIVAEGCLGAWGAVVTRVIKTEN